MKEEVIMKVKELKEELNKLSDDYEIYIASSIDKNGKIEASKIIKVVSDKNINIALIVPSDFFKLKLENK